MKELSRVIIIKGEYKNQLGTLMEIFEEGKPFGVKLDKGKFERFEKEVLLVIDDITNSGNIQFEKGMTIYDTQFEMKGKILEVKDFEEDIQVHKVGWEDGTTSEFTLNEEYNFIVLEEE